MPGGHEIDELLEAIRVNYETHGHLGRTRWVAGKAMSDRLLLVIHQYRDFDQSWGVFTDQLWGVFIDIKGFVRESLLFDVLVEIEEPSPAYVALGADWADDLGVDSTSILWRGDLPESEFEATPWEPPQTTYGDNAQFLIGYATPVFDYRQAPFERPPDQP